MLGQYPIVQIKSLTTWENNAFWLRGYCSREKEGKQSHMHPHTNTVFVDL